MGKATDLDDFLEAQRLTSTEIRQRRRAEKISHTDVEVTSDGRLVKRTPLSTKPEVIQERKTATWD